MREKWRPIRGLEGQYSVSNLGRVQSHDRFVENSGNPNGKIRVRGMILKVCTAKTGYRVVNLGRNRGTEYVHRLVADAFIGEIPKGMTVNHKDGDKSNNREDNLEIVSYQDNHLHAFRELLRVPSCKGKLNSNASKPVVQIQDGAMVAEYPSAREAERQTGVGFKRISACCNGRATSAGGFQWTFKQ